MEEFVVYILFSEKFDKTYIGYSSDLINRIKSHNFYANKGYTHRYRPWGVIYVEFFNERKMAISREKWFKTGVGREYIKMNITK